MVVKKRTVEYTAHHYVLIIDDWKEVLICPGVMCVLDAMMRANELMDERPEIREIRLCSEYTHVYFGRKQFTYEEVKVYAR